MRPQFVQFPGKIHLICDDRELNSALTTINSALKFGFDTETRPSFTKGEVYKVALLQLATETDVFLFRLQGLTQFEPLKSIFENKAVIKVGVAIRDDLKNLQKLFRFVPENFVELQNLAKEKGLKNFGIKGMAEEVLKAQVTKGPKLTNWEASVLTTEQKMYAATDAWLGLKIFDSLNNS